jgi:hypothetical protein
MTLRCYRLSICAFLLALGISTAWAQDQKRPGCKDGSCPYCTAANTGKQASGCSSVNRACRDTKACTKNDHCCCCDICSSCCDSCSKCARKCTQAGCCPACTSQACGQEKNSHRSTGCCNRRASVSQTQMEKNSHRSAGCCNGSTAAEVQEWVMQFVPWSDPANFLPWTLFGTPWAPVRGMTYPGSSAAVFACWPEAMFAGSPVAMPFCPSDEGDTAAVPPLRLTGVGIGSFESGTPPAAHDCFPGYRVPSPACFYKLQVKMMESQASGEPKVHELASPTLAYPLNHDFVCTFSSCFEHSTKEKTKPCGQMTCVAHRWACAKKDCLGVAMSIEKKESHKKHVAKIEVSKICKVGKTCKAVLKSDNKGNPRCWLELCLTKADSGPPMMPFPGAVAAGSPRPMGFPASSPAPMTMPGYAPAPPAAPLLQCGAHEPHMTAGQLCTLHAATENGNPRIVFGCCKGAKMCCERMELSMDGCTIGLSAQGSQIAVSCNGLDAVADCVTKTDHSVLLEGHVRLCTATESRVNFSRFVDEVEITWNQGRLQLHCSWAPDGRPTHQSTLTPVGAWTGDEE